MPRNDGSDKKAKTETVTFRLSSTLIDELRSDAELEGVTDARLFIEPWGILFSTELVVRPVALLPLVADLGRLSVDYPILKVFLDVVDDAMPQLVSGASLLTGAGISDAQFRLFISNAMEAMRQLAAEALHLDYLLLDDNADKAPTQPRVH